MNVKDKKLNNDEILLSVKDLTKQYSKKLKPAIYKLNFIVKRGEFHAFIGANGAGKTTTIKSIVGAYSKFDGEIKISNYSNKDKKSKLKLGYIPEIARFPTGISAYNYLLNMALLNKLSKEKAHEYVKNILIEFKMYNLMNVSPNKFSSGQKKKILLAQALSNDPDILIMDEPAANLDPKARIDFFNILKDLQVNKNKSIFISSHILSELDLYANSLTIVDGGRVVFTGPRVENNKIQYLIQTKDEFNINKERKKYKEISFKKNEDKIIVSSINENKINKYISNLFENNRIKFIRNYKLSIEDMYKKYVTLGSVHTGYGENANYSLKNNK